MRINKTWLPYYIIVLFLFIFSFSVFIKNDDNDLNDLDKNVGKELSQRLMNIQEQLNNFELINKRRKNEILYLQKLVQKLSNKTNHFYLNSSLDLNIELPTIKQYLTHLYNYSDFSLEPAYKHPSKYKKQDVEIVFGLPTIKRPKEFYLISTVKNLIDNLNGTKKNVLFVIMIAETDINYVQEIAAKLYERFKDEIETGLIEIISPPSIYYPDLDYNEESFFDPMGDEPNRVKWRTKQNLDYAYLMMYCKNKGSFYMQLEDDILSRPNYYDKIKQVVYTQLIKKPNWLMIEFSNLGFIGKLFKTKDLYIFINFFLMFHRDKPVDWLLENIPKVKYCRNDSKLNVCKYKVLQHIISNRPPLFQHIGIYSSMKGKIQKLKESTFPSKENLFVSHSNNPKCKLTTDLIIYKNYDLESVYYGYNYFWSFTPKKDNFILFEFENPIIISKYKIKTGNWNHPLDIIYNATLSIKPIFKPSLKLINKYKTDKNGYYIINEFQLNNGGIVEDSLIEFGAITLMKIEFENDLNNWVLISEILIIPKID